MVHCIASGCNNRSSRKSKKQEELEKKQRISFFTFPKNNIRRKAWCKAMNITEACIPRSSTLCSLHFQKDAFYGSPEKRICLKADAIPLLTKPTSTLCKKQTRQLETYNDSELLNKGERSTTPVFIDVNKMETEQDIDVTQFKLLIHDKIATKNMEEKGIQTSPSSSEICKDIAVSTERVYIYNSLEMIKLREELFRTKKHYQSQVKVLKQKTRRMEKKIANMKTILASLNKKQFSTRRTIL